MSDAKIGNQFFEIPFCLIIRRVDISFFIFIVAPLSFYLVLILYSIKDIESSDAPATQNAVPTTDVVPASVESTLDLENGSAAAAETIVARETESAEPARAETIVARKTESAEPARAETIVARETESAEPARAETIVARKTESAEPARAEKIQDAPTAETSAAFGAENGTAAASENVRAQTAESNAASVKASPENAIVSESDAASASELPTASSAAAPIITEPRAEESSEPLDAATNAESDDLPEGPLRLPEKGSPKFVFDYRGRLWVEKKNRGFFRQLRRPQLPPDEPPSR